MPVFCTRLTRGLVEVKLREHRLLDQGHPVVGVELSEVAVGVV